VTLSLFDSATREVAEFAPLTPGRVGIYVCGATVQGSPHVGHLRTIVAFDVLHRWLVRQGNTVTMIRNVTDIEDRILTKSAEAGVEWWAWALRFEREFAAACDALGVLPADYEPRATGHITEIVELIARIIENGHAYESAGSVYFDVRSFPEYGALTNQALGDLAAAADAPEEEKRDPRDFALWKAAKADEPGTASWPSPWGRGRPGWHIECSAMARRYLGAEFDIHGGGLDLRFPHHENEQAQSRAAGDRFARLWMHSAWVTQSGVKMSKSLGNTLIVSEVLKSYPAPALRLALASVHYRSMLEYSDATMDDAAATWARIEGFVRRATERVGPVPPQDIAEAPLPKPFKDAMNDDLAVPRALAVIHKTVSDGNTALTDGDDPDIHAALVSTRAMLDVLGLDPESPQWRAQGGDRSGQALDALVRAELSARDEAREAKDFTTSDAIRDRLAAAGIAVEDRADGSRWSLADGA
jgi:cysteinyl-tRNA synthetase